MKRTWKHQFAIILTMMVALFALAACGGGGGGGGGGGSGTSGSTTGTTGIQSVQTVSGVAAAGAPLIGSVFLKDSENPPVTKGPVQTGPDGSFSFDVTGLTPPFYFQAVGTVGNQSVTLYSVSLTTGTANINPLTSIAVAAAAGTSDPATVFDDPTSYPITTTSLNQAVSAIQTLLGPVFTAYNANPNFLSGTYIANGTRLDQVFDTTSVTLDTTTGAVTLADKKSGNNIASFATNNIGGGEVNQLNLDMQGITAQINALTATMNKGSSAGSADLQPLFADASTFGINDGADVNDETTNYLTWISDNIPQGTVSNVTVALIAQNGDGPSGVAASSASWTYKVGATITLSDGTVYSTAPDGSNGYLFVFDSGTATWKITGNGFHSDFANYPFRAVSYRFILPDASQPTVTGLALDVGDDYNYGIASAVVTGSGLGSGVILAKPPGGTYLLPLTPYLVPGVTGQRPDADVYPITDDTTIGQIPDNAIYTFTFYDASNNLIETRTMVLPKRPLKSTELASALPTLGGLSVHSLSAAPVGSPLSFTYAPPTPTPGGFIAVQLHGALQYWDATGDVGAMSYPILPMNASNGSVSAVPSFTPTAARLDVKATDAFQREAHVEWIFN